MDNRSALGLMIQSFRLRYDFRGRARRAELLLYYFLVYSVGQIGLALHPIGWPAAVDPTNLDSIGDFKDLILSISFGGGVYPTILFLVFLAVSLVLFVPYPALLTRRMHDINASGWWSMPVLLSFFVFNGFMIALFVDFHFRPVDFDMGLLISGGLVLLAGLATSIAAVSLKGNKKQNRYGPDPLKDGGAGIKAAATSGKMPRRASKSRPSDFTNAMAIKLMFQPFRRYFDFSGRARRAEFWLFQFFWIAVSVVVGTIEPASWPPAGPIQFEATVSGFDDHEGALTLASPDLGVFSIFLLIAMSLFSLAIFVPSIAVAVRRLHDKNLTGWWLAFPLAPALVLPFLGLGVFLDFLTGPLVAAMVVALIASFVLMITLLVFFCRKGTDGPNRFGPDPLLDGGLSVASSVGDGRASSRSRIPKAK